MIRKIAWETFKNTGDINAFMELKQIEDIEKNMENKISESDKNGEYKNKWDGISGK